MATLQDQLNAAELGADPVDWYNSRVGAQRTYAEQTLLMAQQHRNRVAQQESAEPSKIAKLNWVVGEAARQHVAAQSYYPHDQKTKVAPSRHHMYWLTAVGFLVIAAVVISVGSWALWAAPFSAPLLRFVLRMFAPFIVLGLLLAAAVTAIVHYAKRR